jgi:hypothetical protein
MGAGSFFQKYVNPLGGGPLGRLAGGRLNPDPLAQFNAWMPNSSVTKAMDRDPIARRINPIAQTEQQREASQHPTQVGGAYAGIAPTLATAASGYQAPAAGSLGTAVTTAPTMPAARPGGQVRPAQQQQQPPQAWMGGPTGNAMLGNYAAAAAAQRAQRIANPWSAAIGGA